MSDNAAGTRELAIPLLNVGCSGSFQITGFWRYESLSEERRQKWINHFMIKGTAYEEDLQRQCCVLHLPVEDTISTHDIAWGFIVPKRVRYVLNLTQFALGENVWSPLCFVDDAAIRYEDRHPVFLLEPKMFALNENIVDMISKWNRGLLPDQGKSKAAKKRSQAAFKALDRYFLAAERDSEDDELIDLWIGPAASHGRQDALISEVARANGAAY